MLSKLEGQLIAAAVALAAILGAVLWLQHRAASDQKARDDAAAAKAQQAEHERTAAENFRNSELAGQLVANDDARKVTYATITRNVDRIVDRPVYLSSCLDADGMRQLAAAVAGKAPDPGSAAPDVPAASAASGPHGR